MNLNLVLMNLNAFKSFSHYIQMIFKHRTNKNEEIFLKKERIKKMRNPTWKSNLPSKFDVNALQILSFGCKIAANECTMPWRCFFAECGMRMNEKKKVKIAF